MIVIPREEGEAVLIGDGVIVTVLEIRDDEVRLAIEYPDDEPMEPGDGPSRRRIHREVKISSFAL